MYKIVSFFLMTSLSYSIIIFPTPIPMISHLQIICLTVFVMAIVSANAGIVKRSYSDQSVRGYLTEVNEIYSILITFFH